MRREEPSTTIRIKGNLRFQSDVHESSGWKSIYLKCTLVSANRNIIVKHMRWNWTDHIVAEIICKILVCDFSFPFCLKSFRTTQSINEILRLNWMNLHSDTLTHRLYIHTSCTPFPSIHLNWSKDFSENLNENFD